MLRQPRVQAMKTFAGASDPLAVLQDRLVADPQRKEDVINVTYEGHYPDEAAAVVNAVVGEYCRAQDARAVSSTASALAGLERKLADRDADRAAAAKAVLDFERANPVLSLDNGKGSNVIVDRMVSLSDALTSAQLEASLAQSYYDGNETTPNRARWMAAQVRADEIKKQCDEQSSLVVALNTTKAAARRAAGRRPPRPGAVGVGRQAGEGLQGRRAQPSYRIAVLEPARPPTKAVWPDPLRLFALAAVAGLVCGAGLALGWDRMDRRLWSVNEVADALGLPVVGAIPHVSLGGLVGRGRQTEFHPHSNAAEAVRDVRTALILSAGEVLPGTLLIASPTPGDGKSMVASNLAISLAKAGKKVLLIDADLRRPTQHRIFRLPDEAGLAAVLAGEHKLSAAVRATGVAGLSILPCGPTPPNPAELLHGRVSATCWSGPASASTTSSSTPPRRHRHRRPDHASVADQTLLVVRCGKSTREASEVACDGLAASARDCSAWSSTTCGAATTGSAATGTAATSPRRPARRSRSGRP